SGTYSVPPAELASLPHSNLTIQPLGEATSKNSTRYRAVLAPATTIMPALADLGCGSALAHTRACLRNHGLERAQRTPKWLHDRRYLARNRRAKMGRGGGPQSTTRKNPHPHFGACSRTTP